MHRKWMNGTESFRNCFGGDINKYYKSVAELHWTGNNREECLRIRVYVPTQTPSRLLPVSWPCSYKFEPTLKQLATTNAHHLRDFYSTSFTRSRLGYTCISSSRFVAPASCASSVWETIQRLSHSPLFPFSLPFPSPDDAGDALAFAFSSFFTVVAPFLTGAALLTSQA